MSLQLILVLILLAASVVMFVINRPRMDAVALLMLRAALACHTGMATFTQAGVSDKSDG